MYIISITWLPLFGDHATDAAKIQEIVARVERPSCVTAEEAFAHASSHFYYVRRARNAEPLDEVEMGPEPAPNRRVRPRSNSPPAILIVSRSSSKADNEPRLKEFIDHLENPRDCWKTEPRPEHPFVYFAGAHAHRQLEQDARASEP